ncbi:hypothetical protein [Oculatella sp. LEGE 06141]|nr:hypothetical protein [Oculatella sp. LEGE 06141]
MSQVTRQETREIKESIAPFLRVAGDEQAIAKACSIPLSTNAYEL